MPEAAVAPAAAPAAKPSSVGNPSTAKEGGSGGATGAFGIEAPPEDSEILAGIDGSEPAHKAGAPIPSKKAKKEPVAKPTPQKEEAPAKAEGEEKQPEATPEPEAEDEGEDIPPETLAQARAMGWSDEQILKFGSVEGLEHALSVIRTHLKAPPPQAPGAKTASEAVKKDAEAPAEVDHSDIPDLDADFDEKAVKGWTAMKQLHARHQKAIEGLTKKLDSQESYVRQARAEATMADFDNWIGGLDEKYVSLLGKGSGKNLDQKSQEFARRARLWDQIQVLESGYESVGLQKPPAAELRRQALVQLYGEDKASLERQDLTLRMKARASMAVARPSHRTTQEAMTRDQAARIAVAKKLRDKGVLSEDLEDEKAGLPD